MTIGKTIALTRWTFVGKVMSLLFNMLSRLVITFLPKSKCLNFMGAIIICGDFGAQKNKVTHCFHCFPIYLPLLVTQYLIYALCWSGTSLLAQTIKHLPTMLETQVLSLVWEDPLESEMATHSSTLAWEIPWTEEPGRLQSMGSQRIRRNWETSLDAVYAD